MKKIIAFVLVAVIGFSAYWFTRPFNYDTGEALVASGAPINLLDGLDTDNPSNGWFTRTFFRVTPTEYRMTQEDGEQALQCTTSNSASIFARDMQIAVAQMPFLSWRWKVTQPIESDADEDTREGDDHPLRFYLRFSNEEGETRGAEIIWSNKKYAPGDYKIIGSFYHYVANGLNENTQQWFDESVDLDMLYSDIGGTGAPTLQTLGFFCDSDNTGAKSDGFITNVVLSSEAAVSN